MDISIIIPAYNAQAKIYALVQALREQTLLPVEIIVADDGSGDGTLNEAESAGAKVLQLTHGGPAQARNAGAKIASGGILVFIDADCMPEPDFLEKLTEPIRNNTAQVAKGAYITEQKSLAAQFAQMEFEERYAKLSKLPDIDFVDSYAMAISHAVFDQAGGFDGTFPRADNEDVDLSYRLSSFGKRMVFVADARIRHAHPTSWGCYFSTKLGRGYWRFKVYARYPAKAFRDSYTPQSLKLQMLSLLLLPPGVILALIFSNVWFTFIPCFLFFLFCLPAIWRAVSKSLVLLIVSPWGLLLRATALISGSIAGFINFILLKK